jgi:hypothetical protein
MINQNLLLTGDDGGYNLTKSLRFRSSASAYLSRTPASAGNRKTWTWSAWVKRGSIGSYQRFLALNGTNDSTYMEWGFGAADTLNFGSYNNNFRITSQVFRDTSAWYHIVLNLDTTQATASNRTKMYINGVQVTAFGTVYDPLLNADYAMNLNATTYIGSASPSGTFFDGYVAEQNFIDGQALTASSFGETDPITGVWKAKKYGGTYGTNGFYLPFSDNTSTTTLGYDKSGNSNNWTTNNISLTAGTTYDSMVDVPTMSALASNYAVLNPLAINYGITAGYYTMSNGNLFASATGTEAFATTTIQMESGKYYAEFYVNLKSSTSISQFGIGTLDLNDTRMYRSDGNYNAGAGNVAYGATYTTGDTVAVAVDITNNTIEFFKNGASQGQKTGISTTGKSWFFWIYSGGGNSSWYANYGQQGFKYTPPTGFVALNTFNLPEPNIKAGNKHFDISLYTGNGTTQSIINSGSMQPSFVWIKQRDGVRKHNLYDAVRGVGKELYSHLTDAETNAPDSLTAFNSNGFSLGNDGGSNVNAGSFVGWQWKANGTGSSNTAGSITSTVSANPTAGFSVVTYTGNGTSGATVGHGLGVAPKMVILKRRNGAEAWAVYHASLPSAAYYLRLNATDPQDTATSFMNNTAPSSSVFTLGNGGFSNTNTWTYVAYCWSEIAGFSQFGKYVGNGNANGSFIYTGFKPRFILIKESSTVRSWYVFDTARDTYNAAGLELYPNLSNAEADGRPDLDILSNGFKLRSTATGQNDTNGTFIYMAFAENPLKYALAR